MIANKSMPKIYEYRAFSLPDCLSSPKIYIMEYSKPEFSDYIKEIEEDGWQLVGMVSVGYDKGMLFRRIIEEDHI